MGKCLFWDFDGTLVYSDSLWSSSVHKSLGYYGMDIDFNMVRAHMKAGFTWHMPEWDYDTKTTFCPTIIRSFGTW